MINSGDPINPTSLVSIIRSKFSNILANIITLIPLGFNELYTITGTKSFDIRPKVDNPIYSSRTDSNQFEYLADISQPNIGVSYYGTPWTQELATNFGVSNNFNYSLGSKKEPFIRYSNKLRVNPATDILGGVPFRGNSPFIYNGFLGMSNSFEDLNIRAYVDTTGTTLTVKARQVSVMSRGTDYSVTDDLIASESDRFNLELITLNNISLDMTLSSSSSGDYLVSLIHNPSIGTSYLSQSSISNLAKRGTYPFIYDTTSDNIPLYTRPLFVVNAVDSKFSISQINSWGETETGTNGDNKFTKLYQQCSSSDTSLLLGTTDIDKRLIPAWFYLDTDNNFIVSKVNYSGLIRHIPGAGASKVVIKRPYYGATTSESDDQNITITIQIGTIELTDSTRSLWLNDINIQTTNAVIRDTMTPYGAAYNRGVYLWLVANPKSIGDTSGSSNTNLRVKLIASPFPVWEDGLEGNLGVSTALLRSGVNLDDISDYTFRCRLGYLPPFKHAVSSTTGTSEPFTSYDGSYHFPNFNWYSTIKGQYNCIGTGSTVSIYTPIQNSNVFTLPQNGITGTDTSNNYGTSYSIKSLDLQYVNSSGTKVTSTNGTGYQVVGVIGNSSIASLGDSRMLKVYNFDGKQTTLLQDTSIALLKEDTLHYYSNGCDGGTPWDRRLKSAWIKGFYLPFDYR